jgi:hypothetical protein
MVLSMIGSAIAAIVSRANMGVRRRLDELLGRLIELLGQVRGADNPSILKLAQLEVDGILAEALAVGGRMLDADIVSALDLAISQVREAIRDKHAELIAAADVKAAKRPVARLEPAKPRALRTAGERARVAS